MSKHEHILTQVEWLEELKTRFGCVETKLEYRLKRNPQKNSFLNNPHYVIDVYGKTKEGKEYFVEIGNIQDKHKLKFLKAQKKAVFIHVPFKGKTFIHTPFEVRDFSENVFYYPNPQPKPLNQKPLDSWEERVFDFWLTS